MKAWEVSIPQKGGDGAYGNGGYVDIHDDGFQADRSLVIEDSEGNRVTLKNEEIGQLYRFIKPALAG